MSTSSLRFLIGALGALFTFVASGCSGSLRSVPLANSAGIRSNPIAAATTPASQAQGYAVLRFRIPVPGRTASRAPHRISPRYVSASTSQVAVILRGQNQKKPSKQSFPCTAVCTGSIVAPIGVDAIALRLLDSGGHVLSQGAATILVFKKKNNRLDLTLDGVPASVDLTPVPGTLPIIPASSGYVLFNARDADGNIITPDGDYTDAAGHTIVFDLASSNAALHLGVTTVSGPGMPIPFYYDGTQHVGSVTLTPSAHRGVTTSVAFHPAAIALLPGIATRIAPPLTIQLLTVTQMPMPGGSTGCSGFPCADPNKLFLLGNSDEQQVVLTFNVLTGAYLLEPSNFGFGGPFVEPPIDLGGNGFCGDFLERDGNFGYYYVIGFGPGYGTSGANPCPHPVDTPIGQVASTLYCSTETNVYDATHGGFVAQGLVRRIRVIGTATYFVTLWVNSQQVSVYGSPVSGALTVGSNVAVPGAGYYGNADGTVSVIGGSTVASFSHAVENVVGYGSSIYAFENGSIFGVSNASGTFESAPLPIGSVVDVVTGVGGVPMLVEQDGTLDVIGI